MGVWLCVSGGKSGNGEYDAIVLREFQELACKQLQLQNKNILHRANQARRQGGGGGGSRGFAQTPLLTSKKYTPLNCTF